MTIYRLKPNLLIDQNLYRYNLMVKETKETSFGPAAFVIPTTTIKTGKPTTFGQCARLCTWVLVANLEEVKQQCG